MGDLVNFVIVSVSVLTYNDGRAFVEAVRIDVRVKITCRVVRVMNTAVTRVGIVKDSVSKTGLASLS